MLCGHTGSFRHRIVDLSVELWWFIRSTSTGNLVGVWFRQTDASKTQVHAVEMKDLDTNIRFNKISLLSNEIVGWNSALLLWGTFWLCLTFTQLLNIIKPLLNTYTKLNGFSSRLNLFFSLGEKKRPFFVDDDFFIQWPIIHQLGQSRLVLLRHLYLLNVFFEA